ncbi:MAG: thioesterase family protein [Phototrophicaceae bacterium]
MILEDILALPQHLRVTIPNEYLDIFEHMNVQHYLGIFSDSVFVMMDDLGMTSAFLNEHQIGLYAVDQRLSYRAEVKAGETVAVYSRLIARSSKSLHFMVFMINESQNQLSATMEALAFHVDRTTKRSTAFLPDITSKLDDRLALDQSLSWDVALSQAIKLSS